MHQREVAGHHTKYGEANEMHFEMKKKFTIREVCALRFKRMENNESREAPRCHQWLF